MGWEHEAHVSKPAIHSRPNRSSSTGFCGVLAVFVLLARPRSLTH
jgi:hypothetical protein